MPKVELAKGEKKKIIERSVRRSETSGLCEMENLTAQSALRLHHNTQIARVCGYK